MIGFMVAGSGEIRGFFYFYRMQITGIILTGGKSRRMGTDKALIEMGGQTLITRAIDFCRTFCDEILISSNIPGHKVEGLQLINDEINDCGPMGGIYSCLKQSTNEWNFVLSVDSPFVTTEFVSFLLTKKDGYNAVVPVHKNGKEPLIALYHKNGLPEIEVQLAKGNFKMDFLLGQVKTNFVDSQSWVEKYPNLFYNMNYPEDLDGKN
jgi:molybdopterin-guanine dinucleotide biosynthesis protein A